MSYLETCSKPELVHQLTLVFTCNNRTILDSNVQQVLDESTKKELIAYRRLGVVKSMRRITKIVKQRIKASA